MSSFSWSDLASDPGTKLSVGLIMDTQVDDICRNVSIKSAELLAFAFVLALHQGRTRISIFRKGSTNVLFGINKNKSSKKKKRKGRGTRSKNKMASAAQQALAWRISSQREDLSGLTLSQLPLKQDVKPGEVLVELRAASLNYRDIVLATVSFSP